MGGWLFPPAIGSLHWALLLPLHHGQRHHPGGGGGPPALQGAPGDLGWHGEYEERSLPGAELLRVLGAKAGLRHPLDRRGDGGAGRPGHRGAAPRQGGLAPLHQVL